MIRNSVRTLGVAVASGAIVATAAPSVFAQAVVEDPMAVGAAVSAFGTTLGGIGAAALLLGLGFLVAYKGWRMISRFIK